MLGEGAADDTNGIVETAEKKISINYCKFKFKSDKKIPFFLLNISQEAYLKSLIMLNLKYYRLSFQLITMLFINFKKL